LKLLYWMSHKKMLYICYCSDHSSTRPIKVYAKLTEIIPEGKKLRGKGKRLGTHISRISLSWCHNIHICCVPLSSSLPHPILIFVTLVLIKLLANAYIGIPLRAILYLSLFSSMCSFRANRYHYHLSTYRALLPVSFFHYRTRRRIRNIWCTSDYVMGFGGTEQSGGPRIPQRYPDVISESSLLPPSVISK
jgi:hypothetical protein